jgi:hypothetical protein
MPRPHDQRSIRSDCALVEPTLHDAGILSGWIFRRLGRRRIFTLRGFLLSAALHGGRLDTADLNLAVRRFSRGRARRHGAGCRHSTSRDASRGTSWGAGCGRRRFTVRDELVITWSAGPRWRIGRQTAGPVRHAIGDIAGKRTARGKRRAEPQQHARGNEPFDNHIGRRVVGPAGRMYRAPLTILSNRVAGN